MSSTKYKVLIIEDEPPAARRLQSQLDKLNFDFELVDIIDSVKSGISFLSNFKNIDLIFMDIQLSDGLSFEIFTEVEFDIPVIFTTAFDSYMLNAFKVHSVDYLLKPIELEELKSATDKFIKYYGQAEQKTPDFRALMSQFLEPSFKERFLVKSGAEIKSVDEKDVAYFYSEDSYTHICTKVSKKHIIDYKLDELDRMLNPQNYFRISRKFVINIHSINKIEPYFNNRLVLELKPSFPTEVLVSRERASDFKSWLDK